MNKLQSTLVAATITIGLLGLMMFMTVNENATTPLRAVLVALYLLLLLNTFFSVRFFLQITPPRDWRQQLMNLCLLMIYVLLTIKFNDPLTFVILIALLFSLATVKYILLAWVVEEKLALSRKILVDAFGTAFSILAIFGVSAGYETTTIVGGAIFFLLANVFVIAIKPIYVTPRDR